MSAARTIAGRPSSLDHLEQPLYWWRVEGGREEFLSELLIEESKALEALSA